MTVTVRSLLGIPNARLSAVAGTDGLDAKVRWVHVSEIEDPTPWLQGGEFVLTVGLRLTTPESMTAYVERLHAHDIAGIGFGTGDEPRMQTVVPDAVLEAANRLGIPVLEIPFETPFIMIAEYVSAQLAAERSRVVQLAYKTQQQLTHAALADDAIGGLVERLAELTHGWAVVATPNGEVIDAYPASAGRYCKEFEEDLERVRSSGTVVSITEKGRQVAIHPLGAPGRLRGILFLGQETPHGAFERMIAASATSLLSFIIEQRTSLSPQRMAAANLLGETLLDPDTPADQFASAAAGLGIAAETELTVARFFVPDVPGAKVAQVLYDVFSQHSSISVTVQDRGDSRTHTLITAAQETERAMLDRLGERFESERFWIGIGEISTLADLHLAYNQASLALSHAKRGDGARIVRFRDLQHYDRIIGLAPPETIATFVATALAPLERLDAAGRAPDLTETLRAFLANHGKWDPAARELGIHRHTLIKRMARIAQLLDVDLDSPDTRMGLWFALSARDAERSSG